MDLLPPQLLHTVSDQKLGREKRLPVKRYLGVAWEQEHVYTLLNKETIIGEIESNEVLMVCGVRCCTYRTAGNIGGQLNLAVWRLGQ